MTIIGTALSTKGGVGKTTTLANISGLLCDLGVRVLLVDADVQPSLTKYYPITHRAKQGLTNLLQSGVVTEDHISRIDLRHPDPSIDPNNGCLDIICSDVPPGKGAELEAWLTARVDRSFRLKNALISPLIDENYDVVLIDTPGAVGSLQQTAVFASSFAFSPVSPDAISTREFASGTLSLLADLAPGERIGLSVPPLHVLICKLSRTRNARFVAQQVRDDYRDLDKRKLPNINMLTAYIPDAVAYCEAATSRLPVHWVDPCKAGQKMHELLWELFPTLQGCVADACVGAFPIAAPAAEAEGEV